MTRMKRLLAIGLCTLITGCGATMPSISSRNAPFETLPPITQQAEPQTGGAQAGSIASPFSVQAVNVVVPRSLSVSEANAYYPRADIVWRGDPIGDRYAQVQSIFETALTQGTAGLQGQTPVVLDIQVQRFHSLTEKARYSVGGVHNMVFDMTVRRASTGEAIGPTRRVEADLPALGGTAAVEADRQGQTQKVRVNAFLVQTIQQELARYIPG